MKRIICIIIITISLVLLCIFNRTNKEDNVITVSEVTHSIFYAPWYVALNQNYFEDLKINVILSNGANNVISAVISGDAQIGLCGAEATFYVSPSLDDKIKSFSSLTKKDGQFIVLRNNIKYNSIEDLKGLTILSGRAGGMPLLSFKESIKDISNVTIDSSVDFANLSSSFISGNGDGVNLFEPNATNLVKNGYGKIVDMIGNYSKVLPYTTFNAKESYIKNNKDIIIKFYNGINSGLEYVNTHSSTEIANIISNQFTDISIEDLITMIDHYKSNDSWFSNSKLDIESFNNLQELLLNNKQIENKINLSDVMYELN